MPNPYAQPGPASPQSGNGRTFSLSSEHALRLAAMSAARGHYDDGGSTDTNGNPTMSQLPTGWVDGDPTPPHGGASGSWGDTGMSVPQALATEASNIAGGIGSAVTLPGDVYAGRTDPMSSEGVQRALSLAAMLPAAGMPMAEQGAVGSAGGALTSDQLKSLWGAPAPAELAENGISAAWAPHFAEAHAKLKSLMADLGQPEQTQTPPPTAAEMQARIDSLNPNNLPNDPASRLSRAQSLGFDTSTPPYHGTAFPWEGNGFRPTDDLQLERATFLTPDPNVAASYSGVEGPNAAILPVYARMQNPAVIDVAGKSYFDANIHSAIENARAAGHDSLIVHNITDRTGPDILGQGPQTQIAMFNPKNIRSVFGTFDPSMENSTDLMSAGGLGAVPSDDRQTRALGGPVTSHEQSDPNSAWMGGPVGLTPHNPDGLPPHALQRISDEVRLGLRPPTRPSRAAGGAVLSPAIEAALRIAAMSDRQHYDDGGSTGVGWGMATTTPRQAPQDPSRYSPSMTSNGPTISVLTPGSGHYDASQDSDTNVAATVGRYGLSPGDPMGTGGMGSVSEMGQTNIGDPAQPTYVGPAPTGWHSAGAGRHALSNLPVYNGTTVIAPGVLGKPGRFHDGTDSTDYSSLQAADPRGSYASGGVIPPHTAHALYLAAMSGRQHFDNGGMSMLPPAYAMRPHFDDGGGDGGSGAGAGDGGNGESGGGVGGMSGSEGGYGGDSSTGIGGVGGAVGGDSVGGMAGSVGAGPAVGGFSGSTATASDTAGMAAGPATGFGANGPSVGSLGNIGGSMDTFGNVSGMQSTGFSAAPAGVAANAAANTGFSAASQEAGLSNVGSITGSVSAPATTSSFTGANGTNNTVGGSLNAGVSADAAGNFSGFGANGLAAGTNLGNMSNTGDNTFGANGLAGTGYSAFGSFSPGAMSNDVAPAGASYAGNLGVGNVGAFGAFGGTTGALAGNVSGMQAGFSTPTGVAGAEGQFSSANSPGYGFSSTGALNGAPSSADLGVSPGSMQSMSSTPSFAGTPAPGPTDPNADVGQDLTIHGTAEFNPGAASGANVPGDPGTPGTPGTPATAAQPASPSQMAAAAAAANAAMTASPTNYAGYGQQAQYSNNPATAAGYAAEAHAADAAADAEPPGLSPVGGLNYGEAVANTVAKQGVAAATSMFGSAATQAALKAGALGTPGTAATPGTPGLPGTPGMTLATPNPDADGLTTGLMQSFAGTPAPGPTDPNADVGPALTIHGIMSNPTMDAAAGTPAGASTAPAGFDVGSYNAALKGVEDPTGVATNPTTQAYGWGQMTPATWAGIAKNNPQLGLPSSAQAATPAQYASGVNALTAENQSALTAAGITADPVNTYMAHLLGAPTARSALSHSDNTPIGQAGIPSADVAANRGLFAGVQTVGDLKASIAAHGFGSVGPSATSASLSNVSPTFGMDTMQNGFATSAPTTSIGSFTANPPSFGPTAQTPAAQTTAATTKTLGVPTKATNLAANIAAGVLGGPIGGLLAGANTISGFLGGPTMASMVNAALSNPGTPGQVGGSGNGNSGQTSSGTAGAIPAPPASTATTPTTPTGGGPGTTKLGPGISNTLSSILGGISPATQAALQSAAQSGSGGIYVPRTTPYNPMTDPLVLHALGYA